MIDQSKIAGYTALAILLTAFVGWAKFSLITGYAFAVVLSATCLFFGAWRFTTGTWPGNDPR